MILLSYFPIILLFDFFVFDLFEFNFPVFSFLTSLYLLIKTPYIRFTKFFIYFLVIVNISIINSFFIHGNYISIFSQQIIFSAIIIIAQNMGKNIEKYCKTIKRMMEIFIILVFIIYIFRFLSYGQDFARLRGNIIIFGGNSFQAYLFWYLLFLKLHREREYSLILGISLLHSIIFISRGAILINLFWILYEIFIYPSGMKKKVRLIMYLILSSVVVFNVLGSDFWKYLTERFIGLSANSNLLLTGRKPILDEIFSWFNNNKEYLLLGYGISSFSSISSLGYTNVHNFFISIIFEQGLIVLVMISYMVFIIFLKNSNRFLTFLIIVYSTFEGVNLLLINSNTYSGFCLFFIIVLYCANLDFAKSKKNLRVTT